jgi:hypothetical protein
MVDGNKSLEYDYGFVKGLNLQNPNNVALSS